MATNLPSCFSIQFLEQLLKFLVKSQRSYGFLITKELIFGFQILDLKDHFSASLIMSSKLSFWHCITVDTKCVFIVSVFRSCKNELGERMETI